MRGDEKKFLQGWIRRYRGQDFCGTNASVRSVCGSWPCKVWLLLLLIL